VIRFVLLSLVFCSFGCASAMFDRQALKQKTMEYRVVNHFTDAMEEENEAALRNATSARFHEKALRSKTAFRDLEILNLPKEDLEVVEIEKSDDKTRQVVVKNESGTKYQFHLIRDQDRRRWVVDDVVFRQQKKGTRVSKSTTEVMDLLLTLREFLETWKAQDREQMLAVCTDDLRKQLETLPEPWLKRLVERITSEYESEMARRPDAQLNENDAHIKLPAKNGFLVVKMVQRDHEWLVSDAELHNRKIENHPGSIRRQAVAMNAVTAFLKSYGDKDHETLKSTVSNGFYDGSLQFADLSVVPLPSAEHAPADFEISAFVGKLSVIIPDQKNIVRVDLITPESENAVIELSGKVVTEKRGENRFVVRDVMLYDRRTQHQTLLSSAFTAPTRAMLFMSMLSDRDVSMLRQVSSQEFCRSIWDRIPENLITQLPLSDVPGGELKMTGSNVRGSRTELEFESADGTVLTVCLSDDNNRLRVDDVQYPNAQGGICSLKTQLEFAVPLVELGNAWKQSDIDGVRRTCSSEFNRLVWGNLSELPPDYEELPELLLQPVTDIQVTPEKATVQLASVSGASARVEMLSEKGYWVVNDVSFQRPEGETVDLRSTFRREIAQQLMQNPKGAIRPVSYVRSSRSDKDSDTGHDDVLDDAGVVHAHAKTSTKETHAHQTGRLTIIPGTRVKAEGDSEIRKADAKSVGTIETADDSAEKASAENTEQSKSEEDGLPKNSQTRSGHAHSEGQSSEQDDEDIVFFGGASIPAGRLAKEGATEKSESPNENQDSTESDHNPDDGFEQPSAKTKPQSLRPVPKTLNPAANPIEIPVN
jgi:hypothetical protein